MAFSALPSSLEEALNEVKMWREKYTRQKFNPPTKPEPKQELVCLGELILGGVIDTPYGTEYEGWDVELDHKVVDALQDSLVTNYPVTLGLYTILKK